TANDGTVYHFNGFSAGAEIHHILAISMRKSTDNGATWTKPRLIGPEHNSRHQVIAGAFQSKDGTIIAKADANPGGTALHISKDNEKTWQDQGGTIKGIHGGVVELSDGRVLGSWRGEGIDQNSALSISEDMSKTCEYSAILFPPITSGHRPILLLSD